MPRLETIDPATATGRVKEIFDGPLAGKHLNIFKGLANSPVGLDAYLGLGSALEQGELSATEREIIQLVIGQANGCDYCLGAHTMMGKGAGLSEDQTVAARKGASIGDAKHDALAKFAGAIHEKKGFVSEDDLSAFKGAGYTDAHVVEVLVTYTQAVFTNYFNHINNTDIDVPAAPSI